MKPAVFNSLYGASFVLLLLGYCFDANIVIQVSLILMTIWAVIFFLAGTRYTPAIVRGLMVVGLLISPPIVHVKSTLTPLPALCIFIALLLKIRYSNYPLPTCKWAFIFISEAIALAIFFYFLPMLETVWPTVIFMFVASVALQSAVHAFRLKEQPAGWLCIAGVTLLIAGDVLAMGGSTIALLCYGLAGYGLVYGTTLYVWQRQGNPYISRQLRTN